MRVKNKKECEWGMGVRKYEKSVLMSMRAKILCRARRQS